MTCMTPTACLNTKSAPCGLRLPKRPMPGLARGRARGSPGGRTRGNGPARSRTFTAPPHGSCRDRLLAPLRWARHPGVALQIEPPRLQRPFAGVVHADARRLNDLLGDGWPRLDMELRAG